MLHTGLDHEIRHTDFTGGSEWFGGHTLGWSSEVGPALVSIGSALRAAFTDERTNNIYYSKYTLGWGEPRRLGDDRHPSVSHGAPALASSLGRIVFNYRRDNHQFYRRTGLTDASWGMEVGMWPSRRDPTAHHKVGSDWLAFDTNNSIRLTWHDNRQEEAGWIGPTETISNADWQCTALATPNLTSDDDYLYAIYYK